MPDFAEPLARLIQEIKRLPGIGQKSAQRIAFYVLRADREDVERLSHAMLDVKDKLGHLLRSATTSATARCASTAAIPTAIRASICVVEEPHNILADRDDAPVLGPVSRAARLDLAAARHRPGAVADSESAGAARGRRQSQEMILATNPTVEGEATAFYLSRLLKPLGVQGDTHRDGHSGRQRSRVRRRSHDAEVAGEPARVVVATSLAPAARDVGGRSSQKRVCCRCLIQMRLRFPEGCPILALADPHVRPAARW